MLFTDETIKTNQILALQSLPKKDVQDANLHAIIRKIYAPEYYALSVRSAWAEESESNAFGQVLQQAQNYARTNPSIEGFLTAADQKDARKFYAGLQKLVSRNIDKKYNGLEATKMTGAIGAFFTAVFALTAIATAGNSLVIYVAGTACVTGLASGIQLLRAVKMDKAFKEKEDFNTNISLARDTILRKAHTQSNQTLDEDLANGKLRSRFEADYATHGPKADVASKEATADFAKAAITNDAQPSAAPAAPAADAGRQEAKKPRRKK